MSADMNDPEVMDVIDGALREELVAWIEERVGEDNGVLLADGFEDAFIGLAQQFNTTSAVYDREECIRRLMDCDKLSRESAEEFFDLKVVRAYVGPQTPIFITHVWGANDGEADDFDDAFDDAVDDDTDEVP